MDEKIILLNKGEGYSPDKLKWGEVLEFPSSRVLSEYGNRIYNRYPARSIFIVPRTILRSFQGAKVKVLDPFMGSGTTAVETQLSGNIPLGVEMDPFARLVATASSSVFSKRKLLELQECYDKVLLEWKKTAPAAVPNLVGIERWFEKTKLTELLQLQQAIIQCTPQEFLPFMLVTFADCIKPCSLMERQSLKPYISTKYKKVTKPVAESFGYSFRAHLEAAKSMSEVCPARSKSLTWLGNDATNFQGVEKSVDVAISSPPYINALDYTRCIKVESALCGLIGNKETAELRKLQVGHDCRRRQEIDPLSEKVFGPIYDKIRKQDIVRADTSLAYFNDLLKNLRCIYRVLKDGAKYHIIIGDNNIRGVEVPTHDIIAELAKAIGFEWVGYYRYSIRDHRTSIPRNNASSKINVEHVLMMQK